MRLLGKLSLADPKPPIHHHHLSSLSSFRKGSSESTLPISCDQQFYENLLQQSETLEVNIVGFETAAAQSMFGSSFVNYTVQVVTDHASFECLRRYRDFRDFYARVVQSHFFVSSFPAKTHWHSKVSPEVTHKRKNQLNQFINEVVSIRHLHSAPLIELLHLLGIKEQYRKLGIYEQLAKGNLSNRKDSRILIESKLTYSHCISHEILKMNIKKNDCLLSLCRLREMILEARKNQLRNQDLKIVLVGNSTTEGLFALAFSSNNELTVQEMLSGILELLDSSRCQFAENFLKILGKMPGKALQFPSLLMQNDKIRHVYFQIVQLYLKSRPQNVEQTGGSLHLEVFPDREGWTMYLDWEEQQQKNQSFQKRRQTRIDISKTPMRKELADESIGRERVLSNSKPDTRYKENLEHESSFCTEIQELLREGAECHNPKEGYELLFSSEDGKAWAKISQNRNFLHLHRNLPKGELCRVIDSVRAWKHNPLVNAWYPQSNMVPFGKIFIQVPHKHEKNYKIKQICYFSPEIHQCATQCLKGPQLNAMESLETCDSFSNSGLLASIFYEPIEKLTALHGFYCCVSISGTIAGEKRLDILYYFISEQTKKYFMPELIGSSDAMWLGFMDFSADTNEKLQ